MKQPELSEIPVTTYYGRERKRTPGTIGMIVGGSLIVVGGVIIAATINENVGEGMGYGIYGFDLCVIGVATAGISGLVFVIIKIAYGSSRYRVGIYGNKNQVGLAYNF